MQTAPAPYLTSDTPPLGGRLRERPEDFLVEEQPLYQPCGSGEHIYILVEKRGLSTSEAVHALSRHFGVHRRDIGYAGMKDKNAVTRQVFSVHAPGRTADDFPMLRNERMSVLWADQHTNKLRLGHLKGNRFSVRIRGVRMTGVLAARSVLRRLSAEGVPNFFGEQRFGVRGNNHRLGRLLALRDWQGVLDEMLGIDGAMPGLNREARERYERGEFGAALDAFPVACRHERVALRALELGADARRAVQAVDITQRRFWFTAFQSEVFNEVLARRVERGDFGRFVAGDIAEKLENGALFGVDAAALEGGELAGRLSRFEVSPTGPLWGARMMRAGGAVGAEEQEALRARGVEEADLEEAARVLGPSMGGARRAMRVPLRDPEIEGGIDEHGEYVRVAFELPPGGFATTVLREIMKTGRAAAPGGAAVEEEG